METRLVLAAAAKPLVARVDADNGQCVDEALWISLEEVSECLASCLINWVLLVMVHLVRWVALPAAPHSLSKGDYKW